LFQFSTLEALGDLLYPWQLCFLAMDELPRNFTLTGMIAVVKIERTASRYPVSSMTITFAEDNIYI